VLSFFPDYADLRTPEKDRITIRHLLTMSTGLDWNDDAPYTNEDTLNRSLDLYRLCSRCRSSSPRDWCGTTAAARPR
jgi:CubicO group peptidase (beta-lactamase class C family)